MERRNISDAVAEAQNRELDFSPNERILYVKTMIVRIEELKAAEA